MINVQMSKDIREFEPKVIGTLTRRQIIAIAAMVAYVVPIIVVIPANWTVRLIIGAVLAFPAILCGWVKLFGVGFEEFFLHFLIPYWFKPRSRCYQMEGRYYTMDKPANDGKEKPKKIQKSKTIKGFH